MWKELLETQGISPQRKLDCALLILQRYRCTTLGSNHALHYALSYRMYISMRSVENLAMNFHARSVRPFIEANGLGLISTPHTDTAEPEETMARRPPTIPTHAS
jgi:hypothetical protein